MHLKKLADDSLNIRVPAFYVEDQNGVLGSQLWVGLALAILSLGSVSHKVEDISVSPFFPLF